MGQTPSARFHHYLIQLRTTLGEGHPDTLAAWRDYTTALMDEGDYQTAQPELRHLVAACEWVFGPEHPITGKNRADWAVCLKESNLYLLALEQYVLVADHDDGYDVRFAAVGCFIRLGYFEEATHVLYAVVRGYEETLGREHEITRLARGTLVFLLAGVHQKEALVEYGRLWGVDKQPRHRALGILAETRLLLATIAADHPQYIRETFNPVVTLPVRNPEFFRFVERCKHHEDFYPNPLQKLAPTLEAPADRNDMPWWRAYCAGLVGAERFDYMALSRDYDFDSLGYVMRQALIQRFQLYGCADRRSCNRFYRYLEYIVDHGSTEEAMEEAMVLLRVGRQVFGDMFSEYQCFVLTWGRYCWELQKRGWVDMAEQEYREFFEEYVESGIDVYGIPYTGYCYLKDDDLETFLVKVHEGYIRLLYDLGRWEEAYDELQRLWNYADDTWCYDAYCAQAFFTLVVYVRYLLLLGQPDEARRRIISFIGNCDIFFFDDVIARWFYRWSRKEQPAPCGKPDCYEVFVRGYGRLVTAMVNEWGNDDFLVICARYNYACYLQAIQSNDSAALVQLREAARASKKLCGADNPLTLRIQRHYAEMLVLAGRERQGLLLAVELVTTCENKWGLRHPLTVKQWASYVCCLHWAGEYQQVVAEAPWVITLCAYEFGCAHPVMMKLFHAAAVGYENLRHYEKACEQWKMLRDVISYLYQQPKWLLQWADNRYAECKQRREDEDDSA